MQTFINWAFSGPILPHILVLTYILSVLNTQLIYPLTSLTFFTCCKYSSRLIIFSHHATPYHFGSLTQACHLYEVFLNLWNLQIKLDVLFLCNYPLALTYTASQYNMGILITFTRGVIRIHICKAFSGVPGN